MGRKQHTLSSIASTLGGGSNSVGSSLASARDSVAYGVGETFAGLADCVLKTAESTFESVSCYSDCRAEGVGRNVIPLLSDIVDCGLWIGDLVEEEEYR